MARKASSSRTVKVNVERRLWADSAGYCMNPECLTELIPAPDSMIGDKSHISPFRIGGDQSYSNLLLLCRNCHKRMDDLQKKNPVKITRTFEKWKKERRERIKQTLGKRCSSFDKLKDAVVPLLMRNWDIFASYGPNQGTPGHYELWKKFEPELISNNSRLELILQANVHLFHIANREIVNEFVAHSREFVLTRQESSSTRVNLFPTKLLSLFGIAESREGRPVSNVSALQRFLSNLVESGRFEELVLVPEPYVAFEQGGRTEYLFLDDLPNVNQVFWSGGYYRNRTTEMRLESLIFFLEWLTTNRITYVFPDPTKLTELILNGRFNVKLCYEYSLSESDMHEFPVDPSVYVVNLHNWNGDSCITSAARDYASSFGMQLFAQREFFRFAHKNIK